MENTVPYTTTFINKITNIKKEVKSEFYLDYYSELDEKEVRSPSSSVGRALGS